MPEISWNTSDGLPTGPRRFAQLIAQLNIDGWKQHVLLPTRGSNILDLVFTNGHITGCINIHPSPPGCDHNLVSFDFSSNYFRPVTCFSFHYRFSPGIPSSFASLIRSTDWSTLFLTSNPQTASDLFYHHVLQFLHLLVPEQANSPAATPGGKKYICLMKNSPDYSPTSKELPIWLPLFCHKKS